MAYSEQEIQETFDSIINHIEENGMALRQILRMDKMPSSRTFYQWLEQDEEKVKRYARATDIRADKIFDEIIEIADETAFDTYVDEDGKERTNHEVINRSRLKIDARKWVLSKMNPKKYGDKIDHTSNGEKISIPSSTWV